MDHVGIEAKSDDREGVIELNGTFLVQPSWGWARRNPLRDQGVTPGHQTQEALTDDDISPRMELVLDSNNLLPFHFLRTGDRMGRAVVKIQRDDGSSGTGFLVAPDVLLTNHHVLPCPEIAATSVALANYEVSPPGDPAGRPAVSPLDPVSLFVTDADLDFTFCGVSGLAYLGSVPLDRERMDIATGETVTIIQHPRGRPKEIALRDNRVVRTDGVVVQYSCDTEPGSSGSPVFNYQWKPVAIHHASVLTDSSEGRRIAAEPHARYLNEGIRLSAIGLWLQSADADSPEDRDQVGRLRALFNGLNARCGFFGAPGRRLSGGLTAGAEVEDYRSRDEVVDLGFWDTRLLAAGSGGLRAGAAEIARAMADMNLDVWCLSDVDSDGLAIIAERLWAEYGLSYRPMTLGGGSALTCAPGILSRPSKVIIVGSLGDGRGPRLPGASLRIGSRPGASAEFRLVTLLRPLGEPASADRPLPALGAIPDPSATLRDGAWIFLGEPDLPDTLSDLGLLDPAATDLIARNPRDGAVVLIQNGRSVINQIYVSTNAEPALNLSHRLAVTRDHPLPPSLDVFDGPRPFALRIALQPEPTFAPATRPSPLADPSPPPSLEALVEQKIRDLLTPVLARIVAVAGGPTPPLVPARAAATRPKSPVPRRKYRRHL
jgi:hypothetical protein